MQVKVIDYSIIESDNHEEFVEAVTKACVNDDWLTAGGVCVWFQPVSADEYKFGANPTTHYAQALVKYGPA